MHPDCAACTGQTWCLLSKSKSKSFSRLLGFNPQAAIIGALVMPITYAFMKAGVPGCTNPLDSTIPAQHHTPL